MSHLDPFVHNKESKLPTHPSLPQFKRHGPRKRCGFWHQSQHFVHAVDIMLFFVWFLNRSCNCNLGLLSGRKNPRSSLVRILCLSVEHLVDEGPWVRLSPAEKKRERLYILYRKLVWSMCYISLCHTVVLSSFENLNVYLSCLHAFFYLLNFFHSFLFLTRICLIIQFMKQKTF